MDFIDLKSQQARLQPKLSERLETVLAHGQYIFGPEVSELEEKLSNFCQAKHTISCANGTDAIILSLRALNVGPGDAVFCPSFTYCATAEAVALIGATPVFVDVLPGTYNMCGVSLNRTIAHTKKQGMLNPKAVIIVDLFGQCADYKTLAPIAQSHGVKIISDAAQGFGSTLDGFHPIHWADYMTTSFFPAKPLGCYGDGGAVFTNDAEAANVLESLRMHGKGSDRYNNVRIGLNSRLDSLQAAVLLSKFSIFDDEIIMRNKIAKAYSERLSCNKINVPDIIEGVTSTWAQYTIEIDNPDALSEHLKTVGIPSARYYPRPTHLQTAYENYPMDPDGLRVTETCMKRVISLPMHAYLDQDSIDRVVEGVLGYLKLT